MCAEDRPCFEPLESRTLLAAPFAVGGDPSVQSGDFRVTIFASDLNFPNGMTRFADGSLLVATTVPHDANGYFGAATGRETPLGEATRQALDKIVDAVVAGMKDVPWSARVIDVRDGVVYINAGASAGIAAGTEFEVFHSGEPLIDPETGRTLGSPESPAGSIVVEKVQDSFSTARMNSGGKLQRGDVVRLKKRSAIPR